MKINMALKRIYIFPIFLLINLNIAFGQELLHRHYTSNDGLPSSTIFSIIQDKEGFIWFGTDVGVTRFDGKTFRNFTLADGLSDNFILTVKLDSKGRLWFLGFNGTVSYWLNGKIYNASSDTLLRKITSSNSFVDFFEDNKHRLWFASHYEYIIIDQNKITRIDSIYTRVGNVINGKSGQFILTNKNVEFSQYISPDIRILIPHYKVKKESGYYRFKDGSIFFIADEGVVWQKDTVQKLIIPFHGEFSNSRLSSMALSKDSLLWICTMGKGVYCFDLKNPEKTPLIYLKNKITCSIVICREGNIWISTVDEGLYMITYWGKKVKLFNKENGLIDNGCSAINKTKDGKLLIGQNNGIIQLITNSKISVHKSPACDMYSKRTYRILTLNDDIWIASDCGVIHQNTKTGCNHFINGSDRSDLPFRQISNVKDITLDDSKIYIATGTQIYEYPIVCKINSGYWATNLKEKFIRYYSIYCDASYQLWYGALDGLHSKKGTAFLNHSKEDVLLSKRINSIAETEDSVLVLATHGYGILFYKNKKIIHRVTIREGLSNDICRKVFIFKNRIYVSTPSGVSVLFYSKGEVLSIQNLNTGNFLPSNDVNDVFADDVDISVATMEGVAVIGNWALEKIDQGIPPVYITEVRVNNRLIAADRKTILSYKNNSLRFNYIGIYFQQPDAVNYRYRIKENQAWQTTNSTLLEFSFLPPGKYVFQLQARVEDGTWSPMKQFIFTITPPFWKTLWFYILIGLLLGLCVYLIVKQRLKTVRKQHEAKAKIVKQITELEQQALQTMMNPHFIFNVMNSIQHFINDNNKVAANRYLTDFAKLIRMNLDISYKRFIPLEEEIEYLQLYLSFEKLRFGDNLTYEISVDPDIDTDETTVAVMMIQPFIENAVWHGILPLNSKGHISLQINKEANDLIKITIEDNGVGISEKFITGDVQSFIKESHALSMTLQRLTLLGKSSGHELYIRYKHAHPEQENKGTIAVLLLPATFY